MYATLPFLYALNRSKTLPIVYVWVRVSSDLANKSSMKPVISFRRCLTVKPYDTAEVSIICRIFETLSRISNIHSRISNIHVYRNTITTFIFAVERNVNHSKLKVISYPSYAKENNIQEDLFSKEYINNRINLLPFRFAHLLIFSKKSHKKHIIDCCLKLVMSLDHCWCNFYT